MFKKIFKNQKGFTLVEILVVIVIIGILFTVILPRIDFASDKARQTGVKTDFKTMQTATEAYLRETSGRNMTVTGLNTYLDKAMEVASTPAHNTTGTPMRLAKNDPWGVKYWIAVTNPVNTDGTGQSVIKYWVTGKGQPIEGWDDTIVTDPDYIGAAYYYKGIIDGCTSGFESGDIKLQSFTLVDNFTTGPSTGTPMCGADIADIITN